MLKSNLDLCFKQIELIDKSISIFRNFYSNDDAISEFWINESIKSLIFATHCELSHHNITIKFESKNDIKVVSIENFISFNPKFKRCDNKLTKSIYSSNLHTDKSSR